MSRGDWPSRRREEKLDPAELAWLRRILDLADAHPVSLEERDAAIAKAEAERPSIGMSEVAAIARTNRAAGTSPELEEAVRLLGMYVERWRDIQTKKPEWRPMPKLGPGGVALARDQREEEDHEAL